MNIENLLETRTRIAELRIGIEHLLEHVQVVEDSNSIADGHGISKWLGLDASAVQEMYVHMHDMEVQLNKFHFMVEQHGSRWRRSRPFPAVIALGEAIPSSLIIPVIIDSMVDGLLIGITASISIKAGIVVALANCLEMAFLGMALTSRVMRCTGSTVTMRYLCIVVSPLLMWLAAGLGGLLGLACQSVPIAFTAVIAFGVVAILFLVCNELLIEARELQGEDPKWWISVTVFLGVFIVCIMDALIPGE